MDYLFLIPVGLCVILWWQKTTIAADNAMLAVRLEDLREAVFGQNGPTLLNRIEDADRRITDGFEAAKSARLEIRREFLTGSEFSNNLYADRIQTHQNFEEVWERIAHLEHRVTGEQATVRSMNYDGPVRASSHVAR